MKHTVHLIFSLLVTMMLLSCSTQSSATMQPSHPVNRMGQVNAVGNTYNISKTIRGGTLALADGSTVVFAKGGKVVNATITGRNIRVVPCGTDVAFENCNFANATIVNSQLSATNFGLKSDMTSKPHNYTFKGKRINTRSNQGTDNTAAWKQVATVLSNSNGVKLTLNGNFYSGKSAMFVAINNARNLEVCGGTVIMGLRFVNCSDVVIHDVKWVGFDDCHDFPPIYHNSPVTVNGATYTTANSYNAVKDGLASCGICDDAIYIYVDRDGGVSENITIRNCHFEMRQNGISAGQRSTKRLLRNLKCYDCTAKCIYFQPIGIRGSNCLIENMVADYCMQGVDISTCSNSVTVRNSRFTRCAIGPKQESMPEFKSMSHSNVIEGCYFSITDDYLMLDASQNILSVSEGAKGDVFTVRNTTFDVKKNRAPGSVKNRTNKVVLDNVTFNVDAKLHPRNSSKWSMIEFFAIFGTTSHTPQFELNNVTINLASGTLVNALCFPHVDKSMSFKANGLKVTGSGVIDTYFNSVSNVELAGCKLNIPSTKVAEGVNSMALTGCNVASTKCVFVNNNANATLRLKNNTIKSDNVVNFKKSPKLVEMSGNNIEITGTEAFIGADSNATLSTKNFKVAGNNFTRKATSAKLLPNGSKYSKLLNNNVLR